MSVDVAQCREKRLGPNRKLLISGSGVRVPVRPPILSKSYDGIAAKSGRLFHSGDTLGDTFCQGLVGRAIPSGYEQDQLVRLKIAPSTVPTKQGFRQYTAYLHNYEAGKQSHLLAIAHKKAHILNHIFAHI